MGLKGAHTLPTNILVAAIDPPAFEAGLRAEDLDRVATHLNGQVVNVMVEQLSPFLHPDSDGTLRGIELYQNDAQGLRLAPPLAQVLRYGGFDPTQVKVTPGLISFPGGTIRTDSRGRIFPYFPQVDHYSYASEASLLETLLKPRGHKFLTPFRPLAPISIPDLLRKGVPTEGKLVLLGMYLPEAEKVEFYTPSGDMARLELYASVVSSLLTKEYFRPLTFGQSALAGLLFIAILVVALPGRRTSATLGIWFLWQISWLPLNQALFLNFRFGNQSATMLAGLVLVVFHLLLRSWRVTRFLAGLGGQAPLETGGDEIEATILFTNLPEAIKEWEGSDPARAQAAREAHSRCVGYVVNKHGGRLVDLQGDAQMIAFGLEGGSHQEQACACAMELVKSVNALMGNESDRPSQAFCGVVTGPVATGKVGGGQYHGVAAIGDTTNSAARLMGKAKKLGKPVLASAHTVEDLGPRADLEEVGELTVKGRAEALKVWELKSFSAPPPPTQEFQSRTNRNLPRAIFLVTTIASLAIAHFLSRTTFFHNLVLDSLTPSQVAAPIVFAGLDEGSLEFHPWPWPRRLHARIAENCVQAGAKCVFLDFLFEDPSTPTDDSALQETVTSHPNVIVAAAAQNDGQGIPTAPKLLPEILAGGHWGLVNHAPQNGTQAMRYGLWQLEGSRAGPEFPGIAKKILQVLGRGMPELNGRSAFIIRWGPRPQTISYRRLLDPEDPIFEELSGKIVVAGDNLSDRSDAFETPYGTLKGAVLHSLAVQTLLTDQLLTDSSTGFGVLLLSWLFSAAVLWLTWRMMGVLSQLALLNGSLLVSSLFVALAGYLGFFLGATPILVTATTVVLGWVLAVVDTNRALTNYIPRQLQEQLEREGDVADITTVGTILLTDIRGYTTLSEGRSPSEILALLNSYHEKTAAVYERYGGHLLTYQGDAQIVVFGPLERVQNPVLNAVRSAQQIPSAVADVAREAGLEEGILRVGSGITTGRITLSLMGIEGQLQYSVFGEPVRRAHHLQHLSDSVEDSIMLDERSRFEVKDILEISEHQEPGGEPFYTVGDEA